MDMYAFVNTSNGIPSIFTFIDSVIYGSWPLDVPGDTVLVVSSVCVTVNIKGLLNTK